MPIFGSFVEIISNFVDSNYVEIVATMCVFDRSMPLTIDIFTIMIMLSVCHLTGHHSIKSGFTKYVRVDFVVSAPVHYRHGVFHGVSLRQH